MRRMRGSTTLRRSLRYTGTPPSSVSTMQLSSVRNPAAAGRPGQPGGNVAGGGHRLPIGLVRLFGHSGRAGIAAGVAGDIDKLTIRHAAAVHPP